MKRKILIGASLACANFLNLEKDLKDIESCGVDYLHYDVMDGHFVPNFALNVDLVSTIRQVTNLPINVHLMTTNPSEYVDRFIELGCESISFHQETVLHSQRLISKIKDSGIKVGLAINPETPLNALEFLLPDLDYVLIMTVSPGFSGQKMVPQAISKINDFQRILTAKKLDIPIQVDGNVSFSNIPAMVKAGATMLVCGTSSLFMKEMSICQAAERIHSILDEIQSPVFS
ncbi:ribulose-phosphate 3-epimerase [Patescibacteria group bacterium]|nr:ribulose-phosphate 3-epimerase [Patescibacteria group bacterium]